MSSSTAASNLAGLWFGDLAAAVQGTWHATAPGHGEARPRQQQTLGLERKEAAAAHVGTAAAKEGHDNDVGQCSGGMSDYTTLCLLLDCFAPS